MFISLLGCPHCGCLARWTPEACCLNLCTPLQCCAVVSMQMFTQNNSFLNLWLDMSIFAQNANSSPSLSHHHPKMHPEPALFQLLREVRLCIKLFCQIIFLVFQCFKFVSWPVGGVLIQTFCMFVPFIQFASSVSRPYVTRVKLKVDAYMTVLK